MEVCGLVHWWGSDLLPQGGGRALAGEHLSPRGNLGGLAGALGCAWAQVKGRWVGWMVGEESAGSQPGPVAGLSPKPRPFACARQAAL